SVTSETFASLVQSYRNERYDESPSWASMLGLTAYDERSEDLSAEAFARREAQVVEWSRRFRALNDGLAREEQIDRDAILSSLRGRELLQPHLEWRRQPNTYLNPSLQGVFGVCLPRLRPERDLAAAARARLEAATTHVEHGRRNLDFSLVPRIYCDRAIGQAKAAARYARELVPAEIKDAATREMVPAAGGNAAKEYEEWTERARSFLKDTGLVTLPRGESCTVEPSPHFQRPIQAVASYNAPPAFSDSFHGHFFVPYPPDGTPAEEVQKRLEGNCSAGIPTTAVHEAYPGHHWHLITAKQNPSPIRRTHFTSYFAEGWGLYAERVMREQGFFTEPRYLLFQYEATLFRAARIVVDTSLHMGEMTFDEAVDFMVKNGNLTPPNAKAEVGRYCSWPTQASSYLTGMLEIVDIRTRWLAKRGAADRAALRAFHDAIASTGSLPTALAERAIAA